MGGCGRVALCSCNIAVVCLLQFQKHLLMRKLGIYKKKIKLAALHIFYLCAGGRGF